MKTATTNNTAISSVISQQNKMNDKVPNDVSFKIINNLDDYKFKRNLLQKRGGKFSAEFNHFVLASVWFFYHDGGKQIDIINGLLRIAHATHGMNVQRLGAYLKNIVPHKYRTDRDVAKANGSSNYKAYAPKFGKKKDDSDYDVEAVQQFIDQNPCWYRFGHNPTENQFNIQSFETKVFNTLKREGIPVAVFCQHILNKAGGSNNEAL